MVVDIDLSDEVREVVMKNAEMLGMSFDDFFSIILLIYIQENKTNIEFE